MGTRQLSPCKSPVILCLPLCLQYLLTSVSYYHHYSSDAFGDFLFPVYFWELEFLRKAWAFRLGLATVR